MALRQEGLGGRIWWRKAAGILTARKQRGKGRAGLEGLHPSRSPLSDPLLPTRPHFLIVCQLGTLLWMNLLVSAALQPDHLPKAPPLNT